MNTTADLDLADEDILCDAVSDEAVEAAAGQQRATGTMVTLDIGCC